MPWKVLFLVLSLWFSNVFAEESSLREFFPPSSLANTENLVNTIVHGCVSVITGDFVDYGVGMVLDGPTPVVIDHGYSSSSHSTSNMGSSWWMSHPHQFILETPKREEYPYYLYCGEDSGGVIPYFSRQTVEESGNKVIFDPGYMSGYTNPGSGRYNVFNNSVELDVKNEVAIAKSCSGDIRTFDKCCKVQELKPFSERCCQKLNKTKFEYTYRKSLKDAVKGIKAFSHGNLYADIYFRYDEHPSEIWVRTHDGRYVHYSLKGYSYRVGPEKGCRHYITKIEGSDCPTRFYTYHHRGEDRMVINSRECVTGNFLKIEFYSSGQNGLDGIGNVSTKRGKDILRNRAKYNTINRVKQLKEPVGVSKDPITTYRFRYHLTYEGNEQESDLAFGSTDVYNAHLNRITYHYNTHERPTKIEYFKGQHPTFIMDHQETYEWHRHNLLSKSDRDAFGNELRTTSYVYDEKGNILKETLSGDLTGSGKHAEYSRWYKYDALNNLIEEGEDEGPTIEYIYVPKTNILTTRYVKGDKGIVLREFKHFDAAGNCFCETHDNGSGRNFEDLTNVTERVSTFREHHINMPLFGKPIQETTIYYDTVTKQHAFLKKVLYFYNQHGRVTKMEVYDADLKLSYTQEYKYDLRGRIIWEKDALGHILEKQYDEENNLLYEKGPDERVEKHYTYDYAHRLIKAEEHHQDGTILVTSHHYNHLNQRTITVDPLGQKTHYFYDEFGRLIQTIYPHVSFMGSTYPRQTLIEYDTLNNPTLTLDKEGIQLKHRYTIRGNVSETIYPDSSTERKFYTLSGKLKETLRADGSRVIYTYDRLGNPLSETILDADNQILSERKNEFKGMRCTVSYDALGTATYYSYDGSGRRIEEKCENRRITYAYNPQGHLYQEKQWENDTLLQVRTKEFDLTGRILEECSYDGKNNLQKRQTYAYDVTGHKVSEGLFTDDGCSYTLMEYDSRGRLIKTTDSMGAATHVAYSTVYDPVSSASVEVTETTDSEGRISRCLLDSAGRVIKTTLHDQLGIKLQQKEYSYSMGGQCLEIRDTLIYNKQESPQIRQWEYDSSGRVIAEIAHSGTPQQMTVRYKYDCMGRKNLTIKNDGTELYCDYDGKGRVVHEYDSKNTYDHRYTYDPFDHPILVEDPLQQWKISRAYNSQGQLISESFDDLSLEYTYDALKRPTSITYPDQSSSHYIYEGLYHSETIRLTSEGDELYHHYLRYDHAGHLKHVQFKNSEVAFTHDPKGRITHINSPHYTQKNIFTKQEHLEMLFYQDPLGKDHYSFSYDSSGQLTSEDSHHYTYDNLGNRRSDNYTPWKICPITNRLLATDTKTYSYDDNGNLISDGETNYSYDSLDRLIRVEKEYRVTTYTYDAFHRRLSKKQDNHVERYLYVGFDEIGSVDKDNTITALRPPGNGQAIELQGKAYAPIYDHRGCLRVLLDIATGDPVATYRYDAFKITQQQGIDCPWKYFGKRYDPETSFTYFGRRYYMHEVGRWLTLDPSGYSAGENGYLFVKNRPFTLFDAYGLVISDNFNFGLSLAESVVTHAPRLYFFNYYLSYGLYRAQGKPKEDFNVVYGHENSAAYELGECDPNHRTALMTQNGMITTRKASTDNALKVREHYKISGIWNVHNSTTGFCNDLFEVICQKLGIPTYASTVSLIKIRELCKMHDNVIIHAHSQGATIISNAMQYLTPEELRKLHIRTFGAATIISPKGLGSCYNYISKCDPVPFIADPIGIIRSLYRKDDSITFLSPDHFTFFDHDILGNTYQKKLRVVAEDDIKRFNL